MPSIDPTLGSVLVLAYAALLLPAAWHKIRDLAVFSAVLGAYRIFPRRWAPYVAPIVPLFEASLAIGLLLPVSRPLAAVGASVLLASYGLAIAVNLVRGRTDLDCGCTGPLERRPVAAWMVYRNALLAGLVLAVARPWDSREMSGLDVFSILAALAVIVLIWLAVDRLLGQVAPRGAALKASR
jgi:uncharacterized membrane protein YphA (DoxX/SURF4 family)